MHDQFTNRLLYLFCIACVSNHAKQFVSKDHLTDQIFCQVKQQYTSQLPNREFTRVFIFIFRDIGLLPAETNISLCSANYSPSSRCRKEPFCNVTLVINSDWPNVHPPTIQRESGQDFLEQGILCRREQKTYFTEALRELRLRFD